MSTSSTDHWHDPALPFVEARRACHSRACYKAHSHPSFSIGAVDEGFSHFRGAGHGSQRLCPGTLVLVPAHRVHACNPEPNSAWSYQMLHLDAEWLQRLRGECGLPDEPRGAPARISAEPGLYRQFCQLVERLFSAAGALEKETALVTFLSEQAWDDCAPLPMAPAADSAALELDDALHTLDDERLAQLTLAELAAMAGLGRYALIRSFRRATGLTPHAWLLNARVNRARQLLREGGELAEVAYRLGFADQSHFQRVFKTHAGTTPGLYRRTR
ncbi:helix-turn-helix transcriptional regulator [Pseudomonas cremoricolorata]|uniref:AraC family transcriptional regulator n=1 Tax=Pseudomonas cremoricolorata TaxID=157783 RepID=A0A089WQE8_9PSED|nr:AraC family transcriptional regulator [Pseudomonas cremoricolorata]AIR90796.1 AraC family transcriptional regulator [Pseudomonas cremoricolorata]